VTEALWAALPRATGDAELLIVARWPDAGALQERTDSGAEGDVEQVLELIRAVRNARATSGTPAAAWLPLEVSVPEALVPTYEALRPAIERLARARPLTRVRDRSELGSGGPGLLGVVAGEIDARLQAAAGDDGADRARIEKELAQARSALEATQARLADPTFLDRAPTAIVEGARARAAELADRVARLQEQLGR